MYYSNKNDAIFKFKRYEDASLTYTGIDRHEDDEVGGWDTVIRREEYEKLFYNQQATMEINQILKYYDQVTNAKNTRVEASHESIVRITAPHYKKNWYEDKLSYHLTSRLYKGFSRYLMGFETCTRILFLIVVIASMVYGILTQTWLILGTGILFWLLRFIMQMIVFRKTSLAMGERMFYSTLLLFDWMQPFWNFRFKLSQRLSRKDDFMRR